MAQRSRARKQWAAYAWWKVVWHVSFPAFALAWFVSRGRAGDAENCC